MDQAVFDAFQTRVADLPFQGTGKIHEDYSWVATLLDDLVSVVLERSAGQEQDVLLEVHDVFRHGSLPRRALLVVVPYDSAVVGIPVELGCEVSLPWVKVSRVQNVKRSRLVDSIAVCPKATIRSAFRVVRAVFDAVEDRVGSLPVDLRVPGLYSAERDLVFEVDEPLEVWRSLCADLFLDGVSSVNIVSVRVSLKG